MLDLAREAAALARWPAAERVSALKRIVPRLAVKRPLREAGAGGRAVRLRVRVWLGAWLVLGLGLFARDGCRQVYRWLRRWDRRDPRGVPGRSTISGARKRVGVAALVRLARAVVRPLADAGR